MFHVERVVYIANEVGEIARSPVLRAPSVDAEREILLTRRLELGGWPHRNTRSKAHYRDAAARGR